LFHQSAGHPKMLMMDFSTEASGKILKMGVVESGSLCAQARGAALCSSFTQHNIRAGNGNHRS
jgi:hypothetical protein